MVYNNIYRLMDTAKEMIKEALPIKCLEAVILGLFVLYNNMHVLTLNKKTIIIYICTNINLNLNSSYLTNNLTGLDRFPLSFRTVFQGHEHRHVVLALFYHG